MSSSENAASHEVGEEPPRSSEDEPLRLVLLGRTGSGRSSTGNSILGRPAFAAAASPSSVTSRCERQSGTVDGRRVSVVDTPGFFHTRLRPQEVMAEAGRCVDVSPPGPHAFLVTLRPGRFTQEERDTLEWIRATFGAAACRFTLVIFTCGDQLQGTDVGDFLRGSEELLEFVAGCRGGYHVMENGGRAREEGGRQVAELLDKVGRMVEENGGGCYGDQMLREAERTIAEARARILGEGGNPESPRKAEEGGGAESERRRREGAEEEARKRAEHLFWCELVTALGRGAAEGAGLVGKDKGKGKAVRKVKVVERAAALAASPLSIGSAAKAVGGAVMEGGKVLYKHRKTFLR